MALPLIGLTATRVKNPYGVVHSGVPDMYLQALVQAGALPMIIPSSVPGKGLDTLLPRLNGVLFTGGGDIDPQHFDGELHERVTLVDPQRDELEFELVQRVIEAQVPFLGICRGHQVINVALGGTLYTDLEAQLPGALKHDYYPDYPRDRLSHSVRLEPDSRLAHLLEVEEILVNSLHHQGVQHVPPDLRPVAFASDGLVEALELLRHPFGMSVQWHPEWLLALAPMRALFRVFVKACEG
ncbi:MAG: gamma-glutamyl-gamma-aminobutyrate hydrolase family protein [Chloroflexota bacterium]